jgi:hypothetical protein
VLLTGVSICSGVRTVPLSSQYARDRENALLLGLAAPAAAHNNNPYTGPTSARAADYDPYTVATAERSTSYIPYTGNATHSAEVDNPNTGRSAD